ncbi:MAG: 2Fe-2S iron-sulfur cluster binding domain-containing protein, partial [Clostridia bacterium]|nr:2Fe-2S iron-sulfur cluster binding domain-containing protein [Clostridia bacterium]
MNRITINNERKVNLLSLLLESNAYINSPCMGTGVCGKCRIKTLSGEYSPVCDAEKAFLTDVEIAEGWRLACMTDAFSDVDVLIPDSEKAHPILSSGHLPDFECEYREGYGAAIDIGTTTVVCSVVNLSDGEIIASAS